MGFMEAYKHLEKLCGEILNNDRCISAYIDELMTTNNGSYLVKNWDSDLKQLKHYRWIRNQIVHNPNCTEQNMCEPGDAEWLEKFYTRIMQQSDPLALYLKTTKTQKNVKPANSANPQKIHNLEFSQPVIYNRSPKSKKFSLNSAVIVFLLFGIISVALLTILVLK